MEVMNDKLHEKRWVILFTTVLLTFMAVLDSSIVNVALPVMSKKLGVSMAAIEWVVTIYLIVIIGMILIFGRLADIMGKTMVFRFGIVIFTVGSLACGISNSLFMLVLARALQAIGASATMATSHGIITHVFPSSERGKALGLNGTFVALGAMVGPPLGGFIVSILSWQYIFLINVPIGVMVFIIAMNTLPKAAPKQGEKFDFIGAILFTLSILIFFGSLTQGQEVGFNNFIIILGFLIAIILFITFIKVEKKISVPLLHFEIFENSMFSLSIFCAFISFVAINCSNIIIPFYLQDVMKLTPSSTGVLMIASPLILAIVAPMSGHISDKIGSEILTFMGLIGTSLGLLLMSTLDQYSNLGLLVAFIALMSVGNGMFQSPNNSLVMSTVQKNKLGIAGSMNALVRNLGSVVGVALSTSLLYNRMSYKVGYHVTGYVSGRDDAFVYGMKYVYTTAAIICAIGAVLTAYRLHKTRVKDREHGLENA